VTDTYDYDAFGNLISSTGSTPNNYLFAGEQFDPALGIYYNRARYYDQRQGRFWSMDTWEGAPKEPSSLHKYLYAGADPVNAVDPSGRDFDLGSVTSALGSISALATTAFVAAQNVLNIVYYNLYRVPQIIDTVSTWLLYAQGTVAIGTIATSTIEQMASNLQSSTQPLPAGGGPMGDQVENIAPGNLVRNTKSYDYFDPDNQIAGQIQGTRTISSAQSLMSVIQRGLGKLNSAPEVVNSRFRDGGAARIVKSDLNVRFLIQGNTQKACRMGFSRIYATGGDA
jgi:RHS repeat-associated protein